MIDQNGHGRGGVLTSLRRNRFPYGKLMDTRHWELEQEYGIQARRLLNRLGLGAGILCGLRVRVEDDGTLLVCPGVAVDGLGREIVVTDSVRIEDRVESGWVTLWLCYHECGAEYIRVTNGDCGHRERCVPGLTDERFSLQIAAGRATPPGLSKEDCRRIFRPGHSHGHDYEPSYGYEQSYGYDDVDEECPPHGRRAVIAELLAGPCTEPEECCVALASICFEEGAVSEVEERGRTPLYSNEELFDLLMCLADEVDRCCGRKVDLRPPRVLTTWPALGRELSEGDWETFLDERRIELVLERAMRELALDQPDSWLGVWQINSKRAQRLEIRRIGGPFSHVIPQPGQEGVVYAVECTSDPGPHTAFLVMANAEPGGPIVGRDDGLALDAELDATGLNEGERSKLWSLSPGSGTNVALLDRLFLPNPPLLPSGNGAQGGELHGAFACRRTEPATPPQLLAVWPPGAALLDLTTDDATARRWGESFVRDPRLEVTVSRAIADDALKDVDGWMRLYLAQRDGDILSFGRLGLDVDGTVQNPVLDVDPDSVTYRVTIQKADEALARFELLLLMRPGAEPGSPEPLGADDPELLLDADFEGTALAKQDVLSVWQDGSLAAPIADLQAQSSLGVELFDGMPGGLVHLAFAVQFKTSGGITR